MTTASGSSPRTGSISVRETVYRLLDASSRETALQRGVNGVLAAFILLNVLAVVAETVPSIEQRFGGLLAAFEAVSVAVFTVEYLLRLATCTVDPRFRAPLSGRLAFALSPLALVDLAAIVPAYLPGEVWLDLRYLRLVRLVRMMRVLKLARYSRTLQTFARVVYSKRDELQVILAFLVVLLVLSSASMYFVEHEAQPETFSSIPAAMWWAVATLTTVGYGDIYPITPLGKLLGSVIALIGIGLFALPAGVLAGAFAEELGRRRRPVACPHCGKEIASPFRT